MNIKRLFRKIGVWGVIIGVAGFMAVGVLLILSGPQVGSVFSAVTKGLGGGSSYSGSTPAAVNPAVAAPVASSLGSAQASANAQSRPADRLIIRNATLSLTSSDVEKSLGEIRTMAVGQDGLVFQSSTTVREDKLYATITLQVPSDTFDQTMNQLRRLSGVKVESENSTSQDVTEEYVDLQAQANNLKASEAELVKLLSKAANVTEVMNVQKELTAVRGEIEQRLGRLNYLEKKSSMSTIGISLAPAALPATNNKPSKGWDPLSVLETAWSGSLTGLQKLYKVGITLGVWAIWIGPLVALAWFGIRLVLKKRRKTFSDLTPGVEN
jgi:hypothetical protein